MLQIAPHVRFFSSAIANFLNPVLLHHIVHCWVYGVLDEIDQNYYT